MSLEDVNSRSKIEIYLCSVSSISKTEIYHNYIKYRKLYQVQKLLLVITISKTESILSSYFLGENIEGQSS